MLDAHFEAIAAVRRGSRLGVEALTRAPHADGRPMAPVEWFAAAERDHSVAELDRACRRLALARLAPLHRADPKLICFVNCHVATFLADVSGPHAWTDLADAVPIDRRAIALQVRESEAADLTAEKLCVAVSTAVLDATGARRLLCVHVDPDLNSRSVDGCPPADALVG